MNTSFFALALSFAKSKTNFAGATGSAYPKANAVVPSNKSSKESSTPASFNAILNNLFFATRYSAPASLTFFLIQFPR